jgi:uncharacterized membrane protein
MPSEVSSSLRRRLPLALAAAWVLPLWIVAFPPMVDYPQQLALSAIVRWYADPARRFAETYQLALWTPHSLFKLLTAGLAWVLPIQVAGKVVVSAALLGVGLAALALCRRTGRPGWYALLVLALTYNYAFYWGFVDNLLAYPLALGLLAMADRILDGPFGWRPWLALAGACILFYTVHLQLLLIFAGGVGWLAICRWLSGRLALRRGLAWLTALIPGVAACVAVMLYGVLRSPEGVISGYERRMRSAPPLTLPPLAKLAQIPSVLFGPYPDRTAWVLMGLLLVVVVVVMASRKAGEGGARSAPYETRFATLAGWLFLLYMVLPEWRAGYLIAQRIAPFAVMVAVLALPAVRAERRRLVAVLAVGIAVFQLGQTVSGFLRYRAESAGLEELLAGTEPGQNLAGLIFERYPASWPAVSVYLHFPAYYQAEKGGRILFSFAELFQTSARFRPGKSWDDLLREWNEWNPQFFDYGRHSGRFRYLLIRGGPDEVYQAFGGDPARLGWRGRSAGRWWLFERTAGKIPSKNP